MKTILALTFYVLLSALCVWWALHGPFAFIGAMKPDTATGAELFVYFFPALSFKVAALAAYLTIR